MQNLPVPTASGDAVPLQAVADVEFGAGPTEIRRYNQIRRVVIGVDLAPGVVNSEAMAKINALPTLNNLPQGVRKIDRSEEHTSELQSLMRNSYAVFCLKKIQKNKI